MEVPSENILKISKASKVLRSPFRKSFLKTHIYDLKDIQKIFFKFLVYWNWNSFGKNFMIWLGKSIKNIFLRKSTSAVCKIIQKILFKNNTSEGPSIFFFCKISNLVAFKVLQKIFLNNPNLLLKMSLRKHSTKITLPLRLWKAYSNA